MIKLRLIIVVVLLNTIFACFADHGALKKSFHDELHPDTRCYLPVETQINREEIDDILSFINTDSIQSYICHLQDFGTRYCYHPNRLEIAEWIAGKFQSYGCNAFLQEFEFDQTTQYNVIAEIEGSVQPDRLLMIGGHYDSIVNGGDPMTAAPGADDNATAIAAALELARVIFEYGYQPRNTLLFCGFAAEEVGLEGSWYMAAEMQNNADYLDFMLNNDMLAYNEESPDEWLIKINHYTGYDYLMEITELLIYQYTTLTIGNVELDNPCSDSYAFFRHDFPVIYYHENTRSPYMHSIDDTIENCDMDYCTEIIKLCTSMMMTMDISVIPLRELEIYDTGSGSSLFLNWENSHEPDFSHYNIYIGSETGVYEQEFSTSDTCFTVTDLEAGVPVFAGVSVVLADDSESFITEAELIPFVYPRIPQGFTANPDLNGIALEWSANNELDLSGYNIYRRAGNETEFSLLNPQPLEECIYLDASVLPAEYYFYYITACDHDGNESDLSETKISRFASLDQGVLVIDCTEDLAPGFGHPDPVEWRDFYEYTLEDYSPDFFDLVSEEEFPLYEIAAYSTIMLIQDHRGIFPYVEELLDNLISYHDFGGNIILSGFRIFDGIYQVYNYPQYFNENHSANSIFGVDKLEYNSQARFKKAHSITALFEDIAVDSTKVPTVFFENHLWSLQVYSPSENADSLFTWQSSYDDSLEYGSMNGKAAFVFNESASGKTAVACFPFFYMEAEDTRVFYNGLLTDLMEEPSNIFDEEITIMPVRLEQNYPNPFNPTTIIPFYLSKPAQVSISVYNLKGQLVKNLIDGFYEHGKHSITWQGVNEKNRSVSSGVYFYILKSGDSISSRRMLLVK